VQFEQQDRETLFSIIKSRRDVRGNRFINEKIPKDILNKILLSANYAPSVGFSQPWRFVIIEDENTKNRIYNDFKKENEKAKEIFKDSDLYSKLKLEGIKESNLNIAVLYKKPKKEVLGQTTQKKMGEYSTVCAIQNMWLTARSFNVGMGWISILKPKKVKKIIGLTKEQRSEYKLIGYFALGYVDKFYEKPELQTLKWENKKTLDEVILDWV
jgi:5,6-dimethylbenzimidazole synthase